MVLTQNTIHRYPFQWDLVTQAFWKKYPNPELEHVLTVNVLNRHLDENGRLHTARLVRCNQNNIPSWMEKIVGKSGFVYEESICDPLQKKMFVKSTNLSYSHIATWEESCTYSTDSTDPTFTTYHQEAKVTAFVPLIAKKLESFSVKNGSIVAAKGFSIMERICRDILETTFHPAICESNDYGGDENSYF